MDLETSRRIIVSGFSQVAAVLAGELRQAGLPEALAEAGHDALQAIASLAPALWDETLRVYLASPLKLYAIAGSPDQTPGYAHLLPLLASAGIGRRDECLRQGFGRLSNEISSLLGRLLLLAARGYESSLADGLPDAHVCYVKALMRAARPRTQ